VLERPLRIIAIVLSLIIIAGFGLFALDEFNRASTAQRNELKGYEKANPTAAGERQREQRNSKGREYIDDANDILLKPFAGIVSSGSRWVQRGVPALLGLFVYGFLLAYLARFMHGRG
jgi:hypothetical protein